MMIKWEVPSHHNAYEPSCALDPEIILREDVEHVGGDLVRVGDVTSEANYEVTVKCSSTNIFKFIQSKYRGPLIGCTKVPLMEVQKSP